MRNLATYLAGTWDLRRRIVHHATGQIVTVEGEVGWTPIGGSSSDDSLQYEERGVMRVGGYEGPATRRYRYDFVSPTAADVLFDDGRFFHHLDIRVIPSEVVHQCGDDAYRGTTTRCSEDVLQQRWSVSGPEKSYTSDTVFRRPI